MSKPHVLLRLAQIADHQASLATLQDSFVCDIQSSYRHHDLALILGAGASVPYGIPTWPQLLQKLLAAGPSISTDDFFYAQLGMTPIILARYLRNAYSDPRSFNTSLYDAIYDQANVGNRLPLTTELLQFCARPGGRPPISSIINYNFDTLLEHFIRGSDLDIPFNSISKDDKWPINDDITIYHPHGVIPYGNRGDGSVVFDEIEYHENYRESINLSNIVQYNAFSRNTCLFIGISLTDPNMRRLLDYAKPHRDPSKWHYIFRKVPNPEVTNLTAKDHINLIERSVQVLNTDGLHFGIKTIWVSSHEEIPRRLALIRNIR